MATAPNPTAYQEYRTGFADQIAPYAEKLLGTAELYTDPEANPYMQYMGERVAQFTPLQQQSYENAALMQTAPQLADATALAGMSGLGALNTQYTFRPADFNAAFGAATTRDAQGNVTGNAMINPYMQNVVERQQSDARRQAEISRQIQDAQAARSGAFGGSGRLLANNQLNASLARQQGDIQAKGLQDAYNQAMGQYNVQNQLNAQQQQFGAGLGLQGLQTANTAAQNLANIGNTQYGQNVGLLDVQNKFGAQQQTQVQNILNNQYQDYLNAQNYPYKQMGFMSDMIRGLPLAQQSSTMYQQPPSMLQQVAGAGLVAKGLGAFAKGGEVEDVDYRDKPAGLADLAIYNMG